MKVPFGLWKIFIKITGWWYAIELRTRYTLFTFRLAARIGLSWLRWRCSIALARLFGSHQSRKPQTEVIVEAPMRVTRLYFYETEDVAADGPMAVARYTAYTTEGKVDEVAQRSYLDDPEGFAGLERDVALAIENEIDVIIYSDREPRDFPLISSYLEV